MVVDAAEIPERPSDALAAVGALRRLANRVEDAAVSQAIADGWTGPRSLRPSALPVKPFTKSMRGASSVCATEEGHLSGNPEIQALGLDRERIVEALVEEERQSLSAVGVSADHYQQPKMASRTSQPAFGASAKLALERGVKFAQLNGSRRFRSQDLLGGVLAAEHGRVPRALDGAGIDVDELRRRI